MSITIDSTLPSSGLEFNPPANFPQNPGVSTNRKFEVMRLNLKAHELKTAAEKTGQRANTYIFASMISFILTPVLPPILFLGIGFLIAGVVATLNSASLHNKARELFRLAMINQGYPVHENLLD